MLISPQELETHLKTATVVATFNTDKGCFEVLEVLLGEGGHATVKLGRNQATGQPVAIKIFEYTLPPPPLSIHASLDSDSDSEDENEQNPLSLEIQQTAKRAAENLARIGKLQAPAVVTQIHQTSGQVIETTHLIMEYVPGISLHDVLFEPKIDRKNDRQKKAISFAQKLKYAISFVQAVLTYHQKGYTLGDIKPDNCLVDGDNIRLVDLDTMLHADDGDDVIFPAQSHGFMAPELTHGKRPNQKSDLFPVGEILASIFMPESEGIYDQLSVAQDRDRLLNRYIPNTEEELQAFNIYKHMLESNPDLRPPLNTVLQQLQSIKPQETPLRVIKPSLSAASILLNTLGQVNWKKCACYATAGLLITAGVLVGAVAVASLFHTGGMSLFGFGVANALIDAGMLALASATVLPILASGPVIYVGYVSKNTSHVQPKYIAAKTPFMNTA